MAFTFEAGKPIYMDYNGTTPVDPKVADAIIPFLTSKFGNPSSSHAFGKDAAAALAAARCHIGALVGADGGDRIVFTSGGTEAINMALLGGLAAVKEEDGVAGHVITSVVEHVAVSATCKHLEANGHAVTRLPVDATGQVSPDAVVAAVTADTRIVSIMFANNEIGTINPVREIVAAVKAAFPGQRILFHTDTSQAIGKVPCNARDLGVDFLTVVGHKMYATKGIAALYVREGTPRPKPILFGGGQEAGWRAGTENVALSVGLGCAARLFLDSPGEDMAHNGTLRSRLFAAMTAAFAALGLPEPRLNGHPTAHLHNTASITFPGVNGAELLAAIQDRVAASAGAACHAGTVEPSYVLTAIGLSAEEALSTLRFSVGRYTTPAEVDTVAEVVATAAGHMLGAVSAKAVGVEVAWPVPPLTGASPLETARQYMADTNTYTCEATVVALWQGDGGAVPPGTFAVADGKLVNGEGGVMGPASDGVVVLDRTVFHPQGGGQPADQGIIVTAGGPAFVVSGVRAAVDGSGAILHYGSWVAGGLPASAEAADGVVGGTDPLPATPVEGPAVVGTAVQCAVSGKMRRRHAALHSAGHLLDVAMSNIGWALPAGKGHHFEDGPYVEYQGDIPAAEREGVMGLLQAECDLQVAANAPTRVVLATPGSPELAACGLRPEDVAHLPPDRPVRVVAVAGPKNWCPCGGTHVRQAADIGRVVVQRIRVKKGTVKVNYAVE